MRRAAVAGGAEIDLARIGLGVGDELGRGLDRKRRRDLEHRGRLHDAGDRHHARHVIEVQMRIERGVDGVRRGDQKQRVAVSFGMDRRLGGDVAAGAVAVLDDKLLAELFRQPIADQPRADVGRSAGGMPTNSSTDRDGYLCARASRATAGSATAPPARRNTDLRGSFIAVPPEFCRLLGLRLHQLRGRAYA